MAMLGFDFLVSIESLIAKSLLEVFSPVAFYALRIGFVTFFLAFFLRPNLKVFGKKKTKFVAILSLLITAEMLTCYI